MKKHRMNVRSDIYQNIATGKKVIESRLYDEKRQVINVGDQIIFWHNEQPEAGLIAVVTEVLRYPTFKELFDNHDPALFGEEDRDFLLNQIKQFYSDEDEERFGVVGIRFKI